MATSNDFKELFKLLNKHNVEYLIVGGYALAYHGAPRFTGDIDVLINAIPQNALKVIEVINEFGFGSLDISAYDFTEPGQVIQLGRPPSRIDLLTSISGVDWEEASAGAISDYFADVPVQYIGYDQFIKNKRAIGRHKDLADIEMLTGKE